MAHTVVPVTGVRRCVQRVNIIQYAKREVFSEIVASLFFQQTGALGFALIIRVHCKVRFRAPFVIR